MVAKLAGSPVRVVEPEDVPEDQDRLACLEVAQVEFSHPTPLLQDRGEHLLAHGSQIFRREIVGHPATPDLLDPVEPTHPLSGVVQEDNLPVEVADPDEVGGVLDDVSQPLLFRLGPLALGDVAVVDRQAVLRRVGVSLDPLITKREVRFELHALVLAHGFVVLFVDGGAHGLGEHLPHVLP
jgi:hypothetical protein